MTKYTRTKLLRIAAGERTPFWKQAWQEARRDAQQILGRMPRKADFESGETMDYHVHLTNAEHLTDDQKQELRRVFVEKAREVFTAPEGYVDYTDLFTDTHPHGPGDFYPAPDQDTPLTPEALEEEIAILCRGRVGQ